MELITGAVFQVCLGATSSPEVPLFRRFQQFWEFVGQSKYETGMADDTVYISDSTISVYRLQTDIWQKVSRGMTTESCWSWRSSFWDLHQ